MFVRNVALAARQFIKKAHGSWQESTTTTYYQLIKIENTCKYILPVTAVALATGYMLQLHLDYCKVIPFLCGIPVCTQGLQRKLPLCTVFSTRFLMFFV